MRLIDEQYLRTPFYGCQPKIPVNGRGAMWVHVKVVKKHAADGGQEVYYERK
jgi:hypothetical protein